MGGGTSLLPWFGRFHYPFEEGCLVAYIARRALYLLPTLVLASIICFVVITLPPGNYLTQLKSQMSFSNDPSLIMEMEYLKKRYGLDKPVYVQYFYWLRGLLSGDLGDSFEWNVPVAELIRDRLPLTLILSAATLLFTWIVAIPIGIYSATHQYSLGDYSATFVGFLGLSTPNFLLALIFMFISVYVFGAKSIGGLFSPQFEEAAWSIARVWDLMKHLWIPVVVLGTSGTASLIRMMRSNLLDTLKQPYVQTARAKGLKEREVVYKYAVRVAINPLISLLGLQFPRIISAATVTAIVLDLPTLGPTLYRALLSQDTYLSGTILMIMAMLLLIGNLVADLLLAWVDPRIQQG
jgi:peptide/nickel transport system permease protein